jgi:hypothetical protein
LKAQTGRFQWKRSSAGHGVPDSDIVALDLADFLIHEVKVFVDHLGLEGSIAPKSVETHSRIHNAPHCREFVA